MPRIVWTTIIAVTTAVVTLTGPLPCQAEETTASVDFNRDVRAMLSDKCFLCHGPAESTREADLRLDDRQSAINSGAITPGKPDESEMFLRIASDDADLAMPPPNSGKSLSQQEIELLRQWIQQDAPYQEHWAFTKPNRPPLPKVKHKGWPRNNIDRFVLANLESKSLAPAPPADPETLARRITLDLTGLPPTIEQLDRVLKDKNELEQLIEQSIKSDHFGERWARWWLDAARYADSAGYEKDMQREVWFYRDWVIKAMNDDMPYDQFVVQQIAGDLLPDAGQSERVATGFLRNSMTNEEGGADPEQFRVEGMFDRMDAIGKAILGITTQCAQCHTHKYDPLTHHEYYEMFAALNDFDEACITVFTPNEAKQRDRVLSDIAKVENEIKSQTDDWQSQVESWADDVLANLPKWTVMHPEEVPFEGQKFRILEDGSIVSESYAPTKASNDFSMTAKVGTITAVRLDALTHPQLPRGGPGRSIDGTGALTEFRLKVEPTATGAKPITIKFVRAIADVNPPQRDLKPQYRDKDPAKDNRVVGPIEFAIDGDEKTAWTTDIGPGRSNQSRHAIFVAESPVVVDGEAKLTFTMVQKHGGWNSDDNQNFLIGRYRFSITDAPTVPERTISSAAEQILQTNPAKWSDKDWKIVFSQWRQSQETLADANETIEQLWQQFPRTATQLVAQSQGKTRPTFVYARGDFLSPTDAVDPGTPDFLHSQSNETEPPRLKFAKWLASADSPTTARVIVNRIWQSYFGRGLVTTPEDFGFQSAPPTHPKLLDYLAIELMDNDWSLRHIHRLIVDSATYRQSSSALPEQWAGDPVNESLSRGPRVRAEAEMVRDIALAASGLLSSEVGGPSVYPPAPDFLFQPPTSYGPKIWNLNNDRSQYRRSLYVHQYRSVPYPPLQVFDAPKGDAACVRRERSNTPLQALVLLNEPQYVDAARALAGRVLREADTDTDRINLAFRLCTSRRPDATEVQWLTELLQTQRQHFSDSATNKDVADLVGVPVDKFFQLTGATAIDFAAWMTVCRVVLNLDETITKS
ncbi:MAG: PSD1 and planctomycete cytochrome C domain-containing protein [Pirellulaceae bacterium]